MILPLPLPRSLKRTCRAPYLVPWPRHNIERILCVCKEEIGKCIMRYSNRIVKWVAGDLRAPIAQLIMVARRSTATFVISLLCVSWISNINAADRPNILFIPIDDLNSWVGHLGVHPQAKTPNIDRLAKRGVSFTKAYCNAPLCNPSARQFVHGSFAFEYGGLRKW